MHERRHEENRVCNDLEAICKQCVGRGKIIRAKTVPWKRHRHGWGNYAWTNGMRYVPVEKKKKQSKSRTPSENKVRRQRLPIINPMPGNLKRQVISSSAENGKERNVWKIKATDLTPCRKEPVRLFRPKETPCVEQQAVNKSRERGWLWIPINLE